MNNNNINYFYVDKGDDPIVQARNLTAFINTKIKNKNFSRFLNKVSKNLSLPLEVVEFETKQYFIQNHNFVTGKFKNIFKVLFIFQASLEFIFTTIYILIFSKKKNFKKKVEIIFDECETKNEINRVKNIAKYFKNYLVISPIKLNNDLNIFQFRKYKECDRDFLFKNFKKFFFDNFFNSIYFSFIEKTNLVAIYLHILKKFIKYETIFNQIRSKFLLQERHYTTSAIKNYIFKKKGGIITSCLQKNIIQIGNTGFCINTDALFSLGRKGTKILKSMNAQITNIVPVGSTFMESWSN